MKAFIKLISCPRTVSLIQIIETRVAPSLKFIFKINIGSAFSFLADWYFSFEEKLYQKLVDFRLMVCDNYVPYHHFFFSPKSLLFGIYVTRINWEKKEGLCRKLIFLNSFVNTFLLFESFGNLIKIFSKSLIFGRFFEKYMSFMYKNKNILCIDYMNKINE